MSEEIRLRVRGTEELENKLDLSKEKIKALEDEIEIFMKYIPDLRKALDELEGLGGGE